METLLGMSMDNLSLAQSSAEETNSTMTLSLQGLSPKVQEKVMMARYKYKDASTFLTKYHPENAFAMITENGTSGMFDADVPTLTILKYAFGAEAVKTFTNCFMRDAIKFNGMYDKVDPSVVASVSEVIQTEYYYLKASELVLFFHWLKSGHFRDRNDDDRGKMYGTFNGEVIMDCLYKFKQERARHLDEVETAKRNKEREEMNKNCVPAPPGVLDLIGKTIASIGHPTKRKLEDFRHIDKDHITTFRPKTADERNLEAEHLKQFQAILEKEKTRQQIKQTLKP